MIPDKFKNKLVYGIPGVYNASFPSYISYIKCTIIGAGGGGVCTNISTYCGGGGGGAGGFIDGYFKIPKNAPITITIGTGGLSCSDGGDSSVSVIGIAYGGKSNSSFATKAVSVIDNTRKIIGSKVSPGGVGGSTLLYQKAAAICLTGGNGGDGSQQDSLQARDGYDITPSNGGGGGGGGGGIGGANGSLGRTLTGGSGAGSFGGHAGLSGDGTVGGAGGVFYCGGHGINANTTQGGGGGAGLFGSGIHNIGGFNNLYLKPATSATGAIGTGGGGSGKPDTSTNRYSKGNHYLPTIPRPYFGLPLWCDYFYSIFNHITGGNSGITRNLNTLNISDRANMDPIYGITAGGIGTSGDLWVGCNSSGYSSNVCGGGGGARGNTDGISIGGNGGIGCGGGGGASVSLTTQGGTGGNGLVIIEF